MNDPVIVVLCGGTSPEREVSLGSGRATAAALACTHATRLVDVRTEAVPAGLDPERDVVCSTLHGTFGEDGGMQRLLDAAGIFYAGCDVAASGLTFDKQRTKETVDAAGVTVAPGIVFTADAVPTADEIVETLGTQTVLKPRDSGSSVGLHVCASRDELATALKSCARGAWLVERRVRGRELTVGVLGGRAMGVVEIAPKSGVFDYTSKYTKGLTEYLAPAPLPASVTDAVRGAAERAFAACGCRDYARVDFMLEEDGRPVLLEINTLPGMKETSLLPMSARCEGLDFNALVRELVAPAVARWRAANLVLAP